LERLGIDIRLLVAQVVNFLILLLILRLTLYKPVMNMLRQRQEKIKENLRYAEQVKEQAAAEREKLQKELEEEKKRGQEALAQASQMSEKLRDQILVEAKEEAARLLEQAREEIEHERKQALFQLRDKVADLSILAAQQVVGQALNEKAHRKLIADFLAKLEDME
jgi:F-type H+-transporting ATPase subunit b